MKEFILDTEVTPVFLDFLRITEAWRCSPVLERDFIN